MLEALYLKAQVSYLAGDVEEAQSTLQHCLDQDAAFSDAHILMAQVTTSSPFCNLPLRSPFMASVVFFRSIFIKKTSSSQTNRSKSDSATTFRFDTNHLSQIVSPEVDTIAVLQVREHPLYHLIKARILKKQGEHEEVSKTLQIAMQLPGVKSKGRKLFHSERYCTRRTM